MRALIARPQARNAMSPGPGPSGRALVARALATTALQYRPAGGGVPDRQRVKVTVRLSDGRRATARRSYRAC
jgi:hypothetical protein